MTVSVQDSGLPPLLLVVPEADAEADAVAESLAARVTGGLGPGGVTVVVARRGADGQAYDRVRSLMAAGHRSMVVCALVTTVRPELDEALRTTLLRHPSIGIVRAGSLGPGPGLWRALAGRVHFSRNEEPTVLLVGEGSADPETNSEVLRAARLLHEHCGWPVEAAFHRITGPDVETGLERCRLLGARNLVVAPYVILPGAAVRGVRETAHRWAARHTDIDLRVIDGFGDHPAVADLVCARYTEVVGAASAFRR